MESSGWGAKTIRRLKGIKGECVMVNALNKPRTFKEKVAPFRVQALIRKLRNHKIPFITWVQELILNEDYFKMTFASYKTLVFES
jgi:hypothetical protein